MDNENIPQNRLIGRKCPACQAEIKDYVFTGLYFPLENKATIFAKNLMQDINEAFIPLGLASLYEIYHLYLSSQCNCGFLSSWSFTKEELIFLIDKKNEYRLLWIYDPKKWEKNIDKITNNDIKKEISNTLDLINMIYKNTEKENESS